jgi:hypothetical protein
MDQYLNHGQFRSIPVFAFFDNQFREIGHFIERPESVTQRNAERRLDMYTRHPEFGSPDASISELPEELRTALAEETATWREEIKPLNNQDVVRSLREIVERVTA